MRALIADDDRVTAAILSKMLSGWQVDVIVARDGAEAWERLKTEPGVSLALIDWMMPGIDGVELCRRIRSDPALLHMHLILLTGRDSHADMVEGLDAGADDYIVKPFDREELRARVNVGLRVVGLQERLAGQVAALQIARDDLTRLAATDALTGLSSRRAWFEQAATEMSRFRRYRQPLAMLMADIDHFKLVNDSYGHRVGDEVLKRFAAILRGECRELDAVGRIGGEEFAVLLPQTPLPAAQQVAHRIVNSFRVLTVPGVSESSRLSCSIGVSAAEVTDATADDVLQRADAALYDAKQNGRDRVEVQRTGVVPAVRASAR